MRLLRFGDSPLSYTFPEAQSGFSTNFGDTLTATSRVPGLHGGFDDLGDEVGASEIGKVNLTFFLWSETREGMTAKRDEVMKMADWGVQKLYLQPTDPGLSLRWCKARVNSIQPPEQPNEHTDLRQPVTMIWQAASPFWKVDPFTQYLYGTALYGSMIMGGVTADNVSGTSTTISKTVGGSAYTQAKLTLYCEAGQSIANPIIQRVVNGSVVDQVSYAGTLNANDVWVVDAQTYSVSLNGNAAYDTTFDYLHPSLFRLAPGSNSIRVLADSGAAGKLAIKWLELYR